MASVGASPGDSPPTPTRLGILGGFGSLATAHFYYRLVQLTPAAGDADHVPVTLVTVPSAPSRLEHLAGRGPTPLPHLIQAARTLVGAGADLLTIPSATCHAYSDDIARAVPVRILHLPTLVMQAVAAEGVRRVALMATTPTVQLGLYRAPADRAGVILLTPDPATQAQVMTVIQHIKAGQDPESAQQRLTAIAGESWSDGADALLLWCTELPAVYAHAARPSQRPTFDATDELVRAVLRQFGHPAK